MKKRLTRGFVTTRERGSSLRNESTYGLGVRSRVYPFTGSLCFRRLGVVEDFTKADRLENHVDHDELRSQKTIEIVILKTLNKSKTSN